MWPNPQETADLVIFTEEIHNGKLHFYAVVGIIDTAMIYYESFISQFAIPTLSLVKKSISYYRKYLLQAYWFCRE